MSITLYIARRGASVPGCQGIEKVLGLARDLLTGTPGTSGTPGTPGTSGTPGTPGTTGTPGTSLPSGTLAPWHAWPPGTQPLSLASHHKRRRFRAWLYRFSAPKGFQCKPVYLMRHKVAKPVPERPTRQQHRLQPATRAQREAAAEGGGRRLGGRVCTCCVCASRSTIVCCIVLSYPFVLAARHISYVVYVTTTV